MTDWNENKPRPENGWCTACCMACILATIAGAVFYKINSTP